MEDGKKKKQKGAILWTTGKNFWTPRLISADVCVCILSNHARPLLQCSLPCSFFFNIYTYFLSSENGILNSYIMQVTVLYFENK